MSASASRRGARGGPSRTSFSGVSGIRKVVRGGALDCQIPRRFRAFGALAAILSGWLVSLLFGGESVAWAAPLQKADIGPLYAPAVARPSRAARVCSGAAPVCAHGAHGAQALAARDALADAFGGVIDGVRMPAPLADGAAGGSSALDLYVVDDLPPGLASFDGVAVGLDPLDVLVDRDASPAFLLVEARALGAGCALRRGLAWGVARASAASVDVGETPVIIDGVSRHVADVVAGCGPDREAHAAFQRAPWQAVGATPQGARELFGWLDTTRGAGVGALAPGLESLAAQHGGLLVEGASVELPDPARYRNAVTVFDVLSETMKQQRTTLDALMLEFATERAFDAVERPPLEWVVPASTLPRRLMVSRGIEPTGATYLRVDLDAQGDAAAKRPDGLLLELKWELGASFRWAVLKLDANGRRVGEVPVAAVERLREIAVDVRHLEGVASVLVVGWNAGDPARPWSPDATLTLPHGYDVAIYAEAP